MQKFDHDKNKKTESLEMFYYRQYYCTILSTSYMLPCTSSRGVELLRFGHNRKRIMTTKRQGSPRLKLLANTYQVPGYVLPTKTP